MLISVTYLLNIINQTYDPLEGFHFVLKHFPVGIVIQLNVTLVVLYFNQMQAYVFSDCMHVLNILLYFMNSGSYYLYQYTTPLHQDLLIV